MSQKSPAKSACPKRSFAHSTYITAAWNWFMILGGQAAEPVLVTRAVMAVLYSRVIHSLKRDNEPKPPAEEGVETLVIEVVERIWF